MKTDTIFKRAFNATALLIANQPAGTGMLSESQLVAQLSVSRTTVRKVLQELESRLIVVGGVIERTMSASELFAGLETVPTAMQLEARFVQWMLRNDIRPGTPINALDLTRLFGASSTSIRELLWRMEHFGVVEQPGTGGWVSKGFGPDFVEELLDLREMIEVRGALTFARLPDAAPQWQDLLAFKQKYLALMDDFGAPVEAFAAMDNPFHRLLKHRLQNRFAEELENTLVFVARNVLGSSKIDLKSITRIGLKQHLEIIEALFQRDPQRIEASVVQHIDSTRQAFLACVLNRSPLNGTVHQPDTRVPWSTFVLSWRWIDRASEADHLTGR